MNKEFIKDQVFVLNNANTIKIFNLKWHTHKKSLKDL